VYVRKTVVKSGLSSAFEIDVVQELPYAECCVRCIIRRTYSLIVTRKHFVLHFQRKLIPIYICKLEDIKLKYIYLKEGNYI